MFTNHFVSIVFLALLYLMQFFHLDVEVTALHTLWIALNLRGQVLVA